MFYNWKLDYDQNCEVGDYIYSSDDLESLTAEEVAEKIRESEEVDFNLLNKLCELAEINPRSYRNYFVSALEASEKLGVEIEDEEAQALFEDKLQEFVDYTLINFSSCYFSPNKVRDLKVDELVALHKFLIARDYGAAVEFQLIIEAGLEKQIILDEDWNKIFDRAVKKLEIDIEGDWHDLTTEEVILVKQAIEKMDLNVYEVICNILGEKEEVLTFFEIEEPGY